MRGKQSGLAVAVALLVAGLSGCVMRIGEGDVFLPPAVADDRDTLEFDREDELRSEFGATVTHQRLELADTRIAVTRARAADMPDAAPLIVSCSGNASDRPRTGTNYAAKLLPFGEAVLWDYPGYGDSEGTASVAELAAVSDAFALWLSEQAGERPLILWGHSLGGFVCSELARRTDAVDAIILETTARNVDEVAGAWKPWWAPVRLRPDEGLTSFDTANALAGFPGPILVVGAGRDKVLPIELHRSLADAIDAPFVSYLEIPEATHYSAGFDPRTVDAVTRLVGQLAP